jgi:hypothetical protein
MKRLSQNRKLPLHRALILNSALAIVCFLVNSALPGLPRAVIESPIAPQTEIAASSARFDALAARTQSFSVKLTNTQRAQVNPMTAARGWITLFQIEGRTRPFPLAGAGDYTASISHPANRAPPQLTA